MKNIILFGLSVILLFTLAGCAPEPTCEAVSGQARYGFLWGFAHGIVFPLAVLAKLFGMDYGLYAVENTGFWYWLGYFIGIGGLGGGASQARRKK
jgi:hypothetical protein